MRLFRKLVVALIAAILPVMLASTWLHVAGDQQRIREDLERDHVFIGRTLRAGVIHLLRERGEQAAWQFVREADSGYPPIRLQLVRTTPTADEPRIPVLEGVAREAVLQGRDMTLTRGGRFVTLVPLHPSRTNDHAIEVSESLALAQAHQWASLVRNGVIAGILLLTATLIAVFFAYWTLGRPIGALGQKVRRIASGDLGGPLALDSRDELAELADELNTMCVRLDEALKQRAQEADARITATEQLRHADRLRTVGQLASGLAHELGTPLNVVLGRARLIAASSGASDETREHARIVAEQAQRMAVLLRQLLDFARRRGPELRETELQTLVAQSCELLAPMARKNDVAIVVRPQRARVAVRADPVQIQQTVSNIVVNAVQAMRHGGTVEVEVGVDKTAPPPDVPASADRFAFIRVKDQGEGIPPENVSHLFEPFFTTKDVGEGTGLGLPVAYGIVRDHGGWIDVSSEAGRGSCFTVWLPLTETD